MSPGGWDVKPGLALPLPIPRGDVGEYGVKFIVAVGDGDVSAVDLEREVWFVEGVPVPWV